QTTIVQMQKDGTYRVVYGTELDKITGSVKLSVVGYGRKTQEGDDTLGGRSATELSANITRFNQALTDDATIRHISLVGCNLDNPTDNSTSTYAAQTLQNLKKIGVTSTSARSDYVAIGPDGRKLTSSTGTDAWKHKDSKAKTHYSFNELTGAVESRVYNSEGTLVRYNGKHLADNNSQYQTNIVLQLSDNETVKNATNALTKKHPDNSYIAKIDDNGKLTVYDLNGNEVNLNVNGKYRINVVAHGSEMTAIGAKQLATHITDLQTKLRIEQTEQGRIALVGCETDKPSSSGTAAEITSLAQLVAKRLYDSGNGTINAEVTGRTTQIEVNADGTKTMLTGGTKTVYS
ncbi:hypothetical protein BSPLISOX_2435, partial [uncultured Gammaproteobacteria bacterium]